MVCGFLLVPAQSLLGAAASSYLIAISYSLMSFLVMLLLYDISRRLGVAIVPRWTARMAIPGVRFVPLRLKRGSAAGRRASPRPAGIAAEIQLALDRRLLQRVPEHLRPVLKTPHQHIPSEQRQQIPSLPKPEIILEMTARVISTASVHLIVVKCV